MDTPLTAQDLWPLRLKLPHDEQVRLAKLALHAASGGGREDAHAYQSAPPPRQASSRSPTTPWRGKARAGTSIDRAGSALNFDHVGIAQRSRLGAVLTTLSAPRWPEVENALLIACGFEPGEDR
jgi:hypothetical protein